MPANPRTDGSGELERLVGRGRDLIGASKSSNTRRAYMSDWAQLAEFAATHGVHELAVPVDAGLVGLWFVHQTELGLTAATIDRRAAAVADLHRRHGHRSPTEHPDVEALLAGIRRSDTTVANKARPLRVDDLITICTAIETDTAAGRRDKALLLVGWAGAMRRSEIVAIDTAHVDDHDTKGIVITIANSKTDQENTGAVIGIAHGHHPATSPAIALRDWLSDLPDRTGPVFRRCSKAGRVLDGRLTPQSVTLILQRRARAVGLDPDGLSAHSLRAGFITEAAAAGLTDRDIANHTRHQSLPVLHSYIRRATIWHDNPTTNIGL